MAIFGFCSGMICFVRGTVLSQWLPTTALLWLAYKTTKTIDFNIYSSVSSSYSTTVIFQNKAKSGFVIKFSSILKLV